MMAVATAPAVVPEPSVVHELVNGEIVQVPSMSFYAGEIANRLNRSLTVNGALTGLGRRCMDVAFRLPLPEDKRRERKPDVAFVTYARWPEDRPLPFQGNAIDVVPDPCR